MSGQTNGSQSGYSAQPGMTPPGGGPSGGNPPAPYASPYQNANGNWVLPGPNGAVAAGTPWWATSNPRQTLQDRFAGTPYANTFNRITNSLPSPVFGQANVMPNGGMSNGVSTSSPSYRPGQQRFF